MKEATEALVRLKETKGPEHISDCGIFRFGIRNIWRSMLKHCEKPASRNDTALGFQQLMSLLAQSGHP